MLNLEKLNYLLVVGISFLKKKHILLLVLTIFANDCFAQATSMFAAQAVKEDFEYLYKTLEVSHYDLYVNTPKEIFDQEYNKIYQSIEDSLTLLQINRLFQPFTALSKLGHCSLELPISSYGPYLQNGGTLFPLNVYFKENQVFVLDNYIIDSSITPGDEIVSINGKPIKDIMKNMYKHISGENDYSKSIQIESLSFPRLFWVVNGEIKNFNVGIKRNGGDEINIELSAISGGEYEGKMATKKPLMNLTRDFQFIDEIAYLRPGQFYNAPKDGNTQINNDMFDNKEFICFLDSCFTVIHNTNTDKLIIDLRGNPGGSASFSNPMVAFFASKPFIGASKLFVKTSQVNKNFWKDYNDSTQLFMDIKKEVLARENGIRFEVSLTKHQPRKDSLWFGGKVYVLINRFSFSEAIVISAMIQDYGFGKIIGEETSPVMYANSRQFKLPHTQITATFPAAYMIRPNGDISLNGTIPDFKVEENLLTKEDEILEYTLKLIKEKK